MKSWRLGAALVPLLILLGCWPAHAQSASPGNRGGGQSSAHIESFILRNAATGVAFNGAVSDSVAGGSSFLTSWVPIGGALQVVFGIRDSLPTSYGGCTPCTPEDSLSVAQIQVSDDTLHWQAIALPAAAGSTTQNDTALVTQIGRLATLALSGNSTGYRKMILRPYDALTTAISANPITARYARWAFTVTTRARGVSGAAGNAPMIGIRIRAWVHRDMDASIPRQFE